MASFLDTLKTLFKPRPAKATGDALYAACVTQSRLPRFYIDYGVADEIGARFELLTLHVIMVVTQLKSVATEQADDTAQALFDAFLLALDTTLREQGTGDLTVPKKMKGIGQVVYTRLKRWDDLWKAGEGEEAQAGYLARTVYADGD
ncbi:MAG: ubiquinol-cytochrome C chaperone, partial [Asticcacaulis sp.]|nr:ubiquinol-cytochrome C chaperone [Asticcacaulis sp.]